MRLSTLLPLMGLLALGYAEKCPRQRTSPGKEILCYTASNNADELLDAICRCTTLVHQGHQLHNISTAGVEELTKTLKEANPVLQVVVSVTDPQGTLRTSATTRQEASGRLANVLSQVDGVELDMSAGSKERLSHFVKGVKDEMIRKSNEKRIILALPTKTEELAKQYDLKTLAKYVDLFTLSTHYLVDDTESFKTFHPSRLMGIFDMLNTDSLVDLVSGMGVPKKKLLVSVPASAYKFTLKNEDKTMPGSSVKEEEPTAISQKELCDTMNAGEWTVERDTDLTAPYAFKDSTWIAYEDKTSVGIKGKYVLLRELAGLGVHDIENDSKNDCGKTVTHEVYRSFTEMKRKTRGAVLASLENDLQHQHVPQSRNVRSSEFRIVRVVDTAGAIHAIRENTQTEFICTRQGYFVHPKSCNRFYRCVKFNQGIDDYSVFEFDCPAGLAFDERTEVCVWPGSLTEGSPCPGSSEIAPVPRARFQCPGRNGYYADPQNCRWFFACFDLGEPELTAYEFRCPFGLVFDEQKLICEWPWLVPSCGSPGYSRTEYGGSAYTVNLQGHGAGSGQGSIAGGVGFGDYSGSGIGVGVTGQYKSGADNSGYPGSRPSESRKTETEFGKYPGIGINGANFQGQGAGVSGGQYFGQGPHSSSYTTFGTAGSGKFGAGDSASTYSGSGASGSQNSGSQGDGSGYYAGNRGTGAGAAVGGDSGSGLVGGGYSGSGLVGGGDSGSGLVSGGYSGSGLVGGGDSGSGLVSGGYSGSGLVGGGYSGSGLAGGGYSGSGADLRGKGVGSTVSGGYSGAGYRGSSNAGLGLTNTVYSGVGSAGSTSSNQGGYSTQGTGSFGGTRFQGGKYQTSTGSGSAQSGYSSGQTASINAHNGPGETEVVIETEGHDSPIYVTGSAGGGHSATGGYTGSRLVANTAGNSGFGGFGSTAANYEGFDESSQGIGKDGLTVSVNTGGSYGGSTGVTGSKYTSGSGYYSGTQGNNAYNSGATRNDYSNQGSSAYAGSDERVSDSQDVINGGPDSGSGIFTGSQYSGAAGTKGDYNSVTKNTFNSLNPAYSVFGVKNPATASPGILVQTVTPGYSVTGSGVSHGIVYGGSTGSEYDGGNTGSGNVAIDHGSDYHGGYVSGISGTAPGLTLGNTGAGNQGGNAYVDTGSSSTVSEIGKGGISTGTTTYHKNGGKSNSYLTSKINSNTNSNGQTNSGTVFTHQDDSGVVITENADQGSVYGGISRPGYVGTASVTPGYISDGVTQTTYQHSAPGTFLTGTAGPNILVTGTAAPGVILHGTSAAGSYEGQGYEGAGVRGSGTTTYHGNTGSSAYVSSSGNTEGLSQGGIQGGYTASTGNDYRGKTTYVSSSGNTGGFSQGGIQGGYVGSTGSNFGSKVTYAGTGASTSDDDKGYKTNEYESNGGRGTVTFNNGYSTSKYTASDVRDRQPAYASLPDTIVSGGRIEGSGGVVLGNTIAGINSYSSQGFTKTGPTKTGFTTAQIGGTGSYITSGGYSGPASTPGSNVFGGQSSGERYSTGSSIGIDVNNLAYPTSTVSPDVSYVDTSKINLGHTSSDVSSGYTYRRPSKPFVTGSSGASTPSPSTVTYHEPVVPLTVTTPSSYLNVQVYNTPSVVTSAPITAAPAVVNTYSTVSSGYKYRRPTQKLVYPSSGDSGLQPTVYQRPNDAQKQYTVTPTPAPISYATGPAEVYKSTLFEAAKLPISVSTVAPVYDTGYKTVISSTASPIAVTTGQYFYSDSRFKTGPVSGPVQTPGQLDVTYQQPEFTFKKQYVSSTPAPDTRDGYTYEKPAKQLTYDFSSTVTPSVTVYQRPAVTVQQQGKYTPVSTIAPDYDGPYGKPSPSIRPAFNQQTGQGGYSSKSTAAPASGFEGYVYSKPTVKFVTSTVAPVYTENERYSYQSEGSPTKLNIPQDEVKKLVGNYNRGGIRYTPPSVYDDDNSGNTGSGISVFGNKGFENSDTVKTYESETPASVIRTNSYSGYGSSTRGQTFGSGSGSSGYRTGIVYSSTPLYEISTVKPATGKGKGKVIVKLSDLHPLLLGKLGAQCTCRSDPFETLRGPGAKIIKSSRGDVDLKQFDESEIYVDLETDREPSQSAAVYRTPNGSPTSSPPAYSSSLRTPVTAVFGISTPAPTAFRGRGTPSTAYLPVSSSPSPVVEFRGGSSAPKGFPLEKGGYGSSSDTVDSEFVNIPVGSARGDIPIGRSAGARTKSGKSLGGSGSAGNAIGGAGAAFDRYGPGGLRGIDETLQGGSDCARPGLFRHPKFCNKFYACHWDEWKQKFTLHVFNCPVHLSFDSNAGACNWPSKGPACQDDNLLV